MVGRRTWFDKWSSNHSITDKVCTVKDPVQGTHFFILWIMQADMPSGQCLRFRTFYSSLMNQSVLSQRWQHAFSTVYFLLGTSLIANASYHFDGFFFFGWHFLMSISVLEYTSNLNMPSPSFFKKIPMYAVSPSPTPRLLHLLLTFLTFPQLLPALPCSHLQHLASAALLLRDVIICG